MPNIATGTTYESEGGTMQTTDATMGHTWVIIVGALVLLWVLGGIAFRTVRM